jgi:hypothetical protein
MQARGQQIQKQTHFGATENQLMNTQLVPGFMAKQGAPQFYQPHGRGLSPYDRIQR